MSYSISSITQAVQASVTITSAAPSNPLIVGGGCQVTAVAGMTQINGLVGVIQSIGGSSGAWTAVIDINTTSFSAYASGGLLSVTSGVPISALPLGVIPTGGEVAPVVQGGQTVKMPITYFNAVMDTAAELATSVVPVNLNYVEGQLYRYGTNAFPGVTDMTTALNNATSVCAYGKAVLQLPAQKVMISGTWDSTAKYTGPFAYPNNTNGGLTVVGAGMNSSVIVYNSGANNTGIGWDMSGLSSGRFQGFSFVGGVSLTNCPQVTLMQGAISPPGGGFTPSLNLSFQDVQVNGYGTYVTLNNGCEQQDWFNCTSVIYNPAPSAVGWLFVAQGSTPPVSSSIVTSYPVCRSMTFFDWHGSKAAMLYYSPVCVLFHFNGGGACADIWFDDWFQALTPSGTASKFMTDDSGGLAATGLFRCGSHGMTLEGAAAGQTNYNVATFNCTLPKQIKFKGHAGATSITQYPFVFGPNSVPTDVDIDWDANESGTFGASVLVYCQGFENGIRVKSPTFNAATTGGSNNFISVQSRTIDGSPGYGFRLQGNDYADIACMRMTVGPQVNGQFIRTHKTRAGNFVSENSDSNDGTQTTAAVATSPTTIVNLPNFGQLVIVNGADAGGDKFFDVVSAPSVGNATPMTQTTISGSPASRAYTVSGGNLQLAMGSGNYAVTARVFGCGMQV